MTPFATAHKFNGYSDVFLNNGGNRGLRDLFVSIVPAIPIAGVGVAARLPPVLGRPGRRRPRTNRIQIGRKAVVALIQNGVIDYSSFIREIETILFHGDTVIVMGLETIKPVGKAPFAGQTVRRRFTNFWMNRKGKWLLTARHASVICQN